MWFLYNRSKGFPQILLYIDLYPSIYFQLIVGRRNIHLVKHKYWLLGVGLCSKIKAIYISFPGKPHYREKHEFEKKTDQQNLMQPPFVGDILN